MKEFRDIVGFYEGIDFKKQQAALVTVVKVRGSSYRGPGARMLLTDDGNWCGAVSGGCLEGVAMRICLEVMQVNVVKMISINTMEEENGSIDFGSGCHGIVDLLIEPVEGSATNNAITALKHCLSFKHSGVMATVIKSNDPAFGAAGQRTILTAQKQIENISFAPGLLALVENDTHEVLTTKRSGVFTYSLGSSQAEVFIEIIQPAINLLVFGAGTDARPVTQFANLIGWEVSVIDKCATNTIAENFPYANAVINCPAKEIREHVNINSLTAAVVMSHNYSYDLSVLKQLLRTNISFIGLMGSQKRTEKIFAELALRKYDIDDHRIHAPVGLDIGAETAEEIAFSIIGEILASFTGSSGKSLKNKTGFIHKRSAHEDEVCKLAYSEVVSTG